jgi:preprotein translocase subunit SecE
VVDCDGLENRCAGNRTGGSNPSPSAKESVSMIDNWPIYALIVVAMGVFIYLWRQGAFLRLSNYWDETMEELKKCTWPTWEELQGSTVVVIVAVALLGGFTMLVDFVVANIVRFIV